MVKSNTEFVEMIRFFCGGYNNCKDFWSVQATDIQDFYGDNYDAKRIKSVHSGRFHSDGTEIENQMVHVAKHYDYVACLATDCRFVLWLKNDYESEIQILEFSPKGELTSRETLRFF